MRWRNEAAGLGGACIEVPMRKGGHIEPQESCRKAAVVGGLVRSAGAWWIRRQVGWSGGFCRLQPREMAGGGVLGFRENMAGVETESSFDVGHAALESERFLCRVAVPSEG